MLSGPISCGAHTIYIGAICGAPKPHTHTHRVNDSDALGRRAAMMVVIACRAVDWWVMITQEGGSRMSLKGRAARLSGLIDWRDDGALCVLREWRWSVYIERNKIHGVKFAFFKKKMLFLFKNSNVNLMWNFFSLPISGIESVFPHSYI